MIEAFQDLGQLLFIDNTAANLHSPLSAQQISDICGMLQRYKDEEAITNALYKIANTSKTSMFPRFRLTHLLYQVHG